MKTKLRFIVALVSCAVFVIPANGQNNVINYQGRVQSGGENFTGVGQFKFALVTSVNFNAQAAGEAVVNGGFVTDVTPIETGNGYLTPPVVTVVGGGGSGAIATAVLSNDGPGDFRFGRVESYIIDSPGSGYTSIPMVIVEPPPEDLFFTTYWSNDGTGLSTEPVSGGSEPVDAVTVPVNNGQFSVGLGDVSLLNMLGLEVTLFSQPDLEVRIWFDDGVDGFSDLSPTQPLSAMPYAMTAASAGMVDGTVDVSQLAGQISSDMLADGAVSGLDSEGGKFQNIVSVDAQGRVGIGSGEPLKSLPPTIVPMDSDSSDLAWPRSVAVQGNYAYVADFSTDLLKIFDITDPNNIVPLDSENTGLDPYFAAVQGNYAYVVNNETSLLQIFDVTDPSNIVRMDSDGTNLDRPRGVAVQGNYDYVGVIGTDSLQIFDVANPSAIVALDSDGTNLVSPTDVVVRGNLAYVIDLISGSLHIFDITDPSNIVPLDSDGTNLVNPVAVAVQGNYAYVVDLTADVLQVFDVTNPTAIVALDSIAAGQGAPSSVAVQGDYAYVVDQGIGLLQRFDISDPSAIVALDSDTTNLGSSSSVVLQGNYAYVVDFSTDALQIFDVRSALAVSGTLQVDGNLIVNNAGEVRLNTTRFSVGNNSVAGGDNSMATGQLTQAVGDNSTAMGSQSSTTGHASTAMGNNTLASGDNSTAMGNSTIASGNDSTAMGRGTQASGSDSTATGTGTKASGDASIAMGRGSTAAGENSIAAGFQANALHDGSFVWGDNVPASIGSSAANQFTVRASGGTRFFTNADSNVGVKLNAGANSWSTISDRNRKKDIIPLDGRGVLDKLIEVPISTWHYDFETDGDTLHIGPMAQDFKAVFYPGRDDKSITTHEFDGVALAAIQGLNSKLEETRAENMELKRELAEIRNMLKTLTKIR